MFTLGRINEDRSGELIGAGIAGAGNSLADAIAKYGAMRDEAKGYQQIVKALAQDPTSGIDPDSVDKMSIWDAKNTVLGANVRQQIAQQRAAAQAQAALPAFLQNFARNMQPQPGNPDTVVPGSEVSSPQTGAQPTSLMMSIAGGQVPPTPAPVAGLPPLAAALRAASQRPEVLNTEIGRNVLEQAIKRGMVKPVEDNMPVWSKGPNGEDVMYQPKTKNAPTISPFSKSAARMTEIDATTKAAAERDAAKAAQREKDRSTLTPKDLLASYQADLKSLDNPMNWGDSTPEERAAHRATLNAKITALREPSAAGTGQPKPAATSTNSITTKGGFKVTW